MSTETTSSKTPRGKKVLVPKVWKRPHSTIYGKNVEFGSSLYSDKIGELNGRKFNSELPWSVRNSGGTSSAGSSAGVGSSGPGYNQGYLSNLLLEPKDIKQCGNYADLLSLTNPRRHNRNFQAAGKRQPRIDFYEQYMDFGRELDRLSGSSLLMSEPMLTRKLYNHLLEFDYELGLFVPSPRGGDSFLHASDRLAHHAALVSAQYQPSSSSSASSRDTHYNYLFTDLPSTSQSMMLSTKRADSNLTNHYPQQQRLNHNYNEFNELTSNLCHPANHQNKPIHLLTRQTNLLPRHKCHLADSPYGQSADGRKLSLSSINPQSYRPSLPSKTTHAHATDGEEVDLVDKSSPFYTDR